MTLSTFFHDPPAPEINECLQAPTAWENLINQASAELVLPGLASRANALGLQNVVPPEMRKILACAEQFNLERNHLMMAEAIKAATLLNSVGIRPVALKGLAYLLTGTYANPAARYLADIDLLVSIDQLRAAISCLKKHEYFEDGEDQLAHLRHHHSGMRQTGMPTIELHHQVGIGICNKVLPANHLIADSEPISVNGATFLVPSPTHLVVHLILHSQLAHPYQERIFVPLRALIDLSSLHAKFGSKINWSRVYQVYQQARESSSLILHLKHASSSIGLNISATDTFTPLSLFNKVRWQRRVLLNRYPRLRFVDVTYLLMSLFSRRLRLIPRIISHPELWLQVTRTISKLGFYRRLSKL